MALAVSCEMSIARQFQTVSIAQHDDIYCFKYKKTRSATIATISERKPALEKNTAKVKDAGEKCVLTPTIKASTEDELREIMTSKHRHTIS